jgi:hypothetical protein
MIFRQHENGSCDIVFSEEEIQAINKKKQLHLSDKALKHFGNHLMNIIVQWQLKFNNEVKNSLSDRDTEIIPNLEK